MAAPRARLRGDESSGNVGGRWQSAHEASLALRPRPTATTTTTLEDQVSWKITLFGIVTGSECIRKVYAAGEFGSEFLEHSGAPNTEVIISRRATVEFPRDHHEPALHKKSLTLRQMQLSRSDPISTVALAQ